MTNAPKRLTLKDLMENGGIVDTSQPKKRGRNPPRTALERDKSIDGRRVNAVIREIVRLGGARGSEAKAIRIVATTEPGYKSELATYVENQIKQSLKRYKKTVDWAQLISVSAGFQRYLQSGEELERRCRGFPDDVRVKTDRWSADALLHYLRENDIDGTCPKEFVDFVRSQ